MLSFLLTVSFLILSVHYSTAFRNILSNNNFYITSRKHSIGNTLIPKFGSKLITSLKISKQENNSPNRRVDKTKLTNKRTTDQSKTSEGVRINKCLLGLSRRAADEAISEGRVTINGDIVTSAGTRVLKGF